MPVKNSEERVTDTFVYIAKEKGLLIFLYKTSSFPHNFTIQTSAFLYRRVLLSVQALVFYVEFIVP